MHPTLFDPSLWTAWRPLKLVPSPRPDVLDEIVNGGQSFRWNRSTDGTWIGVWANRVVKLQTARTGTIHWSTLTSFVEGAEADLLHYFGSDYDYPLLADQLPWRSDPHLKACMEAFPGLRLLHQPFGETLLHFLCSATKQIVQIKQMAELLAAKVGVEIVPGFHRSPTWEEIATAPDETLRACLLGFRAKYIKRTAAMIAERPGLLAEIQSLPYEEAKTRLQEFPGVGGKVADCVLLFGGGKLEAFPVDVWITKTLANRYGLQGWTPQQTAHFGRMHFGPSAGFAQQFLFAYERKLSKAAASG